MDVASEAQLVPSWSWLGGEDHHRRGDALVPVAAEARADLGPPDPFVVDWALVEDALRPQRAKGYAL